MVLSKSLKRTAFVIIPGEEDPAAVMRRGGLEVKWKTGNPLEVKWNEVQMPRVVDADLALPTLYLHFLGAEFLIGNLDLKLASGNDNSELNIALPSRFMPEILGDPSSSRFETGNLGDHLVRVLDFLRAQGETPVECAERKSAADSTKVYFSLKTARPKSARMPDKASFGLPASADLYRFVNNHDSVAHMDEEERESFEACIEDLPSEGEDLAKLAIFLKVFYEGGFAYNEKRSAGANSDLPVNVGIACMSVMPAFEGQTGISTGYPYVVPSRFLPFADTVPVTIRAISEMSPRHQRYGLCFSRCVMVWAGEDFEQERVLNYSVLTPHGGFFYVPGSLKELRRLGGLVYAFGEAREALERPEAQECLAAAAAATEGGHATDDC